MWSYRSIVLLAFAAAVLGIASPYLVDPAPDMSAVVFAWFYWLPGLVSYWLSPEDDATFMALAMAVYAAQYVVLFAGAVMAIPLVKVVVGFARAPRKAGG